MGRTPECAGELHLPRDERLELGHWAPVGAIPERYDKATRAAELIIRARILGRYEWGGVREMRQI